MIKKNHHLRMGELVTPAMHPLQIAKPSALHSILHSGLQSAGVGADHELNNPMSDGRRPSQAGPLNPYPGGCLEAVSSPPTPGPTLSPHSPIHRPSSAMALPAPSGRRPALLEAVASPAPTILLFSCLKSLSSCPRAPLFRAMHVPTQFS